MCPGRRQRQAVSSRQWRLRFGLRAPHSPVSVPFYENRMGYERRAIIFQKLG
jgi:hypothetical protein